MILDQEFIGKIVPEANAVPVQTALERETVIVLFSHADMGGNGKHTIKIRLGGSAFGERQILMR